MVVIGTRKHFEVTNMYRKSKVAAGYNLSVHHIVGKFGEFGELSTIHQTKLVLTINNLLADLLICQTFFAKCSKQVNSPNFPPTKLSRYMVCATKDYPP